MKDFAHPRNGSEAGAGRRNPKSGRFNIHVCREGSFPGSGHAAKPTHVVLAVLTSAIWGGAFVAIEIGLESFSPPQLTALRFHHVVPAEQAEAHYELETNSSPA